MELQYYGGNCVRLVIKKVQIVIDDNLVNLGQKSILKDGDIALYTDKSMSGGIKSKYIIDGPGDYEISEIMIHGIPSPAHIDDNTKVTMYSIHADGFSVAITGHTVDSLTEEQLEQLGMVDLLIIPVGGHGFTLDPVGARKLIKKIEPKAVVLTSFDDPALKYPVPQTDLDTVLRELAIEPVKTDLLKIKDFDPEQPLTFYVLDRK